MENIKDTITGRAKQQTTSIAQTIVSTDSAKVTTSSNRILTSPQEIQNNKSTTTPSIHGKLKDYTRKMK